MNAIFTLLKTNPALSALVFSENGISLLLKLLFILHFYSVNDGKVLDSSYILIKSA